MTSSDILQKLSADIKFESSVMNMIEIIKNGSNIADVMATAKHRIALQLGREHGKKSHKLQNELLREIPEEYDFNQWISYYQGFLLQGADYEIIKNMTGNTVFEDFARALGVLEAETHINEEKAMQRNTRKKTVFESITNTIGLTVPEKPIKVQPFMDRFRLLVSPGLVSRYDMIKSDAYKKTTEPQ